MKKNIYKMLIVSGIVGATFAPSQVDFLEVVGLGVQSVQAKTFSHNEVLRATVWGIDDGQVYNDSDSYHYNYYKNKNLLENDLFSESMMQIISPMVESGGNFIDINGNVKFGCHYAGNFKNGYTYTMLGTGSSGLVYIDKNGNYMFEIFNEISERYSESDPYFSDVSNEELAKYGLVRHDVNDIYASRSGISGNYIMDKNLVGLIGYVPEITNPLDKDLKVFSQDGKYGYKSNTTGEIVIPAIYQAASLFNEEHAVVLYNNYFHVIKNPLIYCITYDILDTYTGIKGISLAMENGKYGYVTTSGTEVVPLEYDSVAVVSDTNFLGYKGDEVFSIDSSSGTSQTALLKSGYQKDHEAVFVSEIKNYDYVGEFHDGIALVGNSRPLDYDYYMGPNYNYGAMDIHGNEIMPPVYLRAEKYSDGLMSFLKDDYWSYYNKNGEVVLENVSTGVEFSGDAGCIGFAESFSDGVGFIADENVYISHYYYNYSYIDSNGKKGNTYSNFDANGGDIFGYSDGLALVNIDGFAYIDKEDNVVLSEEDFDENIRFRYKFSEGLVAVLNGETYDDSTRLGFMDKNGEMVIPFLYDATSYNNEFCSNMFSEGIVAVMKNGKVGCIDMEGNEIIPFQYDKIEDFNNGYAIATRNGKSMYIDKQGNELENIYNKGNIFSYDGIESLLSIHEDEYNSYHPTFSEGLIADKKDNLWGYVNTKGEVIIPYMYSSASDFYDGHAQVTLGDKRFVIKNPLYDEKYNISFNPSTYNEFKDVDEYIDYLITILNEMESISLYNISEIENYIIEILKQIDYISVEVENNNIIILNENFHEIKEISNNIYEQLNTILGSNGLSKMSDTTNEKIQQLPSGIVNIADDTNKEIVLNNISKYNVLETPNFTISDEELSKLNTQNVFNALQEKLTELGEYPLNERGMIEVEKIIDHAFKSLEPENINGKNNTFILDLESQQEVFNEKVSFYTQFLDLIKEYSVKLSKNLDRSVDFIVKKLNMNQPIRVEINNDLNGYFDKVDTIEIVLDTNGTKVSIPTKDLVLIMENRDKLIIEINYGENNLDLKFIEVDSQGNEKVLSEIEGKLYFSLPTYSNR